MSRAARKLTAREKQTYLRLLARTKPFAGRLALAVFFGMLFGSSIFGLLFSAKGGMAQVFGGSATNLQKTADVWLNRWYAGGLNHDFVLTLAVLAVVLFCIALRGATFFFSKYLIEWVAQRVVIAAAQRAVFQDPHTCPCCISRARAGRVHVSHPQTPPSSSSAASPKSSAISSSSRSSCSAPAVYCSSFDLRLAAISLAVFRSAPCPWPSSASASAATPRPAGTSPTSPASSRKTSAAPAIVKAFGTEDREQARFAKHNGDFSAGQIKFTASRPS
jgi:hypothetical protein